MTQLKVQNPDSYLLEMNGISKSFPGVKALDNVHLKVRPHTVHALMGENGAGKSTLMKCLFGIYQHDEGEIIFNNEKIHFRNPRQALDNGVSMVHQELNQVQERSVMENIWLGRFPMKGIVVDRKKMYNDTKKIFDDLSIDIDPNALVGSLSVSQRQMVEIAKAVSSNAKIIVFDEPTSSLTEVEVKHLFRIIDRLRNDGCGIIYISHKLEEILEISDEVTVLRDGKWVYTGSSKDLDIDKLITLIVGRELTNRFPSRKSKPSDEIILRVENLAGEYMPTVVDASFELRKGEILGVAGLMGSRRTETIETLFGLRKRKGGVIKLKGKQIENNNPREAISNGFALLTEERRETGIFPTLDITFNSIIANIDNYTNKFGILNEKKIAEDTKWVIDTLSVKTPGSKTKIQNLSGGNQQKVIMGRWLLTEPTIMLLDEPTRGIDVGAKYDIYELIIECAEKGNAIIFISSEMPELLGISDRIMVMSNGRVAGIVDAKTTTQEELLRLASKYL
ncbi:MAG: galactose/methyl galactoside ABC transporter ATP-binding protein MglA [Clostridiaceae bacterium]|nr:galactose/methyl galactoside ABC transporter ATP-binding protein MglA [Clostridiaceae bacterium]